MKVEIPEHYFSPSIPEALPPTERVINALIEERGGSLPLYFTLGNVRLRKGEWQEAVEAFDSALVFEEDNSQLRTNRGIALARLGRHDEAITDFRKAVLQSPQLFLPHFYLAQILLERNESTEAMQILERALRLEPERVEILSLLSHAREIQGEHALAEKSYLQIYSYDPNNAEARMKLARYAYRRGEAAFMEGREAAAFSIWGQADEPFSPFMRTDQEIKSAFRILVQKFRDSNRMMDLESRFQIQIAEQTQPDYYELYCYLFFSLGLFPEGYEDKNGLEYQAARWLQSLETRGEHPYPHFRIALIKCYQGKLEEALTELRLCQDRFPKKKQDALKLTQIVNFTRDLDLLRRGKKKRGVGDNSESNWREHGFDNLFEIESWKREKFFPDEAARWRVAGFSVRQAAEWQEADFEPELATTWTEVGFNDPKAAKRWSRRAVSPEVASRWMQSYGDDVDAAVQWIRAGFDDPAQAKLWHEAVLLPSAAQQWRELGFCAEEVKEWKELGVSDPFEARDNREELKKVKGKVGKVESG